MTNKITLYRLKGKMPEKKKCDWQGTNATTSEVTGYNQAIDDLADKFEKVEIDVKKIAYLLNNRNSLGIRIHELSAELIAQAILELLKGEKITTPETGIDEEKLRNFLGDLM